MFRLVPSLATALAALMVAAPVLAADYEDDYYDDMRPSYPDDWDSDEGDPLGFEVGLRYWYSLGTQSAGFGTDTVDISDQTQSGEAFVRIDDHSTSTYVKALGGLSFAMTGESTVGSDGLELNGTVIPGRLGYVVGDFGWTPLGNEDFRFGGLVGYQYWNDSPNNGRGEFAVVDGVEDVAWTDGSPDYSIGYDSEVNNLDIHALRLGITAHAELGEMFDVNAELAAIPYAWVSGVLGPHSVGPFDLGGATTYKSSVTDINGYAFGAAGELMFGFHPTKNITLRLGGRAWYLNGQLDATFNTATITDPLDLDGDGEFETGPTVSNQRYIQASDFASLFRYGALFEATFAF